MKNTKVLSLLNLVAFIATIIINALANAMPINGRTTGELSEMYPNLFVPAGITFSIWGLIYLLLLVFVVYQLILAFYSAQKASVIHKIGWWFIISSIANCGWILAWHYVLPELSLLIMLLLLFSLSRIYLELDRVKPHVSKSAKWIVYPCFSVYLGWITVATIANTTAVLVDWGWTGGALGGSAWAIVMMIIAAIMGVYFAIFRKNIAYTLVIVWALHGIYLKRSADLVPVKWIVLISQFGMFLGIFSVLFILIRTFAFKNHQ